MAMSVTANYPGDVVCAVAAHVPGGALSCCVRRGEGRWAQQEFIAGAREGAMGEVCRFEILCINYCVLF